MACLDTTVFVDLRGRAGKGRAAEAQAALDALLDEGESIVTTRLNLAELYVGVERSAKPAQERQWLNAMLQGIAILEFDALAAEHFGRLKAHQQSLGMPTGDMDALVAAVSLANDHVLVTRNMRHFDMIPGLEVRGY